MQYSLKYSTVNVVVNVYANSHKFYFDYIAVRRRLYYWTNRTLLVWIGLVPTTTVDKTKMFLYAIVWLRLIVTRAEGATKGWRLKSNESKGRNMVAEF